ncbi:MAG: TonB-dependent receptor, partial [Gillisia sp.]
AQQIVSGKVIDTKGAAIAGANIFIQGTYDGETSAEDGSFSFKTSAEGEQVLVVSFLSFQTQQISLLVSKMKNLQIVLKEDLNSLDAVIINAGTFEAGDKSRVSVLKPLDIVTTAGSAGNIIAALQTLPGTQTVGESGRLFVRGGEAGETQTFVDGLRVSQPYNASVQNIPSRGRFSPFLFSGISFSTGGYSAEYGNALSGILLLNTENEVSQEKTEISLMTVGAGIGNTQKWEHESLNVNGSYINLAPYMALAPQNINWNHPYQSLSGEAVYRNSLKKGIWKVYAAFDASTFDFNREASDFTSTERIELKNNNFYFNTSYNGNFGDKWQIISGLSYGYNLDNVHFNEDKISDQEQAVHLKNKLSKRISESVKLSFGADFFSTDFQENYDASEMPAVKNNFQEILFALYSEADIRFSKNFALKAGMRGTYNALFKESYLSPRLSLAYKTSKSAQFSVAYGNFVQTPGQEYLKYTQNLTSEKAAHYIVNYQFQKENTLLRLEAYYKRYNNLITYSGTENQFSNLQNTGKGYAKGLDLF